MFDSNLTYTQSRNCTGITYSVDCHLQLCIAMPSYLEYQFLPSKLFSLCAYIVTAPGKVLGIVG